MKHFSLFSVLLTALVLPILSGCGGGTASTAGSGRLTLSLALPETPRSPRTRVFGGHVPLGTRSIRVRLIDPAGGGNLAPVRLVTPPPTGAPPAPINITYNNIRLGNVRVEAEVFPDTDGEDHVIATGTGNGQVVANTTNTVTVPFTLTLNRLQPSTTTVNVSPVSGQSNHTVNVSITAFDSQNRDLLYPFQWLSNDPGIAQVTVNTSDPTSATIRGVTHGTTMVIIYEPNSGMTTPIVVNSFPNTGQGGQ